MKPTHGGIAAISSRAVNELVIFALPLRFTSMVDLHFPRLQIYCQRATAASQTETACSWDPLYPPPPSPLADLRPARCCSQPAEGEGSGGEAGGNQEGSRAAAAGTASGERGGGAQGGCLHFFPSPLRPWAPPSSLYLSDLLNILAIRFTHTASSFPCRSGK